ncbi:MAG: hypothetical protein GWP08_21090 [Nitrospiraceae bacterium]|nr:hypothetical protein [Nitrospiraceae bacterium]
MKFDARVVFSVLAIVALLALLSTSRGCRNRREGGVPLASSADGETGRPIDVSRFRGPLVSTMALAEGLAGADAPAGSARESVSLQYDALLERLGLTPDAQRAALDALVAHFEGRAAQAQPGTELGRRLAQLLSYEQAEVWFAYEESLPERLLYESVELELRGTGAGLAPEAVWRACEIVVDEYLSAGVGQNFAFGPMAQEPLQTIIDKQRESLSRMRARFSEEFDEEQMAVLTPFLDRHKAAAEMTLKVMKGEM